MSTNSSNDNKKMKPDYIPDGNKAPQEENKFKRFLRSPFVFPLILVLIFGLVNLLNMPGQTMFENIQYSEFLDMLDNGEIKSVQITGDQLIIEPKSDLGADTVMGVNLLTKGTSRIVYYVTTALYHPDLIQMLHDADIEFDAVIVEEGMSFFEILVNVLPLIMMAGMLVWIFMMIRNVKKGGGEGGGMGAFGFAKSKAKQIDVQKAGVRFTDVAGQDEAKESLIEIVDILKNPTRYTSVGAEIPKGALLVGPPGTGKTLLAKAVAGEAGCPFFFVSGSAFVEMFVGTGAARVRDLFKEASQKAPCIIFIDEIDAIGKKRDGSGIGGNDEREQTLNQLLAEMDGFDPEKGIIVLGATNRPEILDKALLRPGRFDRRIPVELPDLKGRLEILEVHARKKTMEPDVDLKKVADATPGASGAELANILNEAALNAVRMGRKAIGQSDLEHATEYVIAGSEKKSMVISPEEKRIIAYHEIGHALVAAKQKNAVPIRKITIIPRTSGALGFTMQADEEEKYLMKKEDLIQQLQTLVAGRAAEELIFGTITSGASNDIERATSIARQMITRFGMNDQIGLMALDTVVNPYLDGELRSSASPEAAALVEKEMRKLISDAYAAAMQILKDNAADLNRLAQYLLENENITGDEFRALCAQPIAAALDDTDSAPSW